MNLLQISYFLALAKQKSFKKTAEALYVSQPAVSMQISALEKEWGLKLFSRNYKEVELTPAGEIMFRMFNRAFNEYDIALDRAKSINENPTTILNIGVPEYFEIMNLAEIFESYQSENPNVSLHVEVAPLSQLTPDRGKIGHFDLVINHEFLVNDTPEVNTLLFAHRRHALFISDKHPLCKGNNVVTPADLSGETVYATANKGNSASIEYTRFVCKSQGFTPGLVTFMPNVNSALLAAKLCQGVCLLDDLISLPADYDLRMIETDVQLNWLLVWSKTPVSPYVEDLARAISTQICLNK